MDQCIVHKCKKRESSTRGNTIFLPDEIVSEILSWLKVKSLLRCKSVCKRWFSMIQDKEFVEMHMTQKKGTFHKFHPYGESFNLDGVEEKVTYFNTCNGLLLEKRLSSVMPSPIYRIRNPSTKGILNLPCPPKAVVLMHMYLNSETGSYIVVCGYVDEEEPNFHLDLLDLGPVTNDRSPNGYLSWKTLGSSEICKPNGQATYYLLMCVSADGILYIFKGIQVSRNLEIVCIDLGKKVSTTCTVPQSLLSYKIEGFSIMLWHDKPTVLSVQEKELKIWVLDDYKKQKWVERVISLPGFILYLCWKVDIPFLIHEDGEDILSWDDYNFGYKLQSKVICVFPPYTLDVAETLVSLKGMQPQKKAG